MGGKSRKTGRVSKELIDRLKRLRDTKLDAPAKKTSKQQPLVDTKDERAFNL